jgi:hypothetical protein
MRYRFLVHYLHHTILAINITGLSPNEAGVTVNGHSLPYIQFTSWDGAKQHFLELGAGQVSVDAMEHSLRHSSLAVLTIT